MSDRAEKAIDEIRHLLCLSGVIDPKVILRVIAETVRLSLSEEDRAHKESLEVIRKRVEAVTGKKLL